MSSSPLHCQCKRSSLCQSEQQAQAQGQEARDPSFYPNQSSTYNCSGQDLDRYNAIWKKVNAASGSTKVTNHRERNEMELWLEVIKTYSNVFIYLMHCNTPLRMALQRSSAVVSGWTLPRCSPVHALNTLNTTHAVIFTGLKAVAYGRNGIKLA